MRDLPLGGRLDARGGFSVGRQSAGLRPTGFRRFGIRALFGAGNYARAMPPSNSKRFEALRLASARFTPIQPDRPESSELFTALDSVRCPRRVNALKLTMFSMSERFGTKPACERRTAQVDFGQKSLFPLNPWEDLMSPYLSLQRFLLVAGTAALLVGPLAMPAGAALLAYDSFTVGAGPADYLAGDEDTGTDVLGGQNPATGPTAFYAGGWIQPAGDSQVVKNIGSLAYPLFPQAGGQIQETLQFDCCTFGRSGREIAGGLGGGRDPRTIYQSFLIDFGTQGTDAPTDFGKRAYEMWSGGMGDSNLAVDLFVNHFTGVNELTLAVTTASGTQSVLVDGGGLTLDELAGVHLVVFKFEFDPVLADTVSVFLDPTDSIEANYTPVATISVASSDLLITHHGTISNFTFSGAGHIPGAFDELRWGDTFADVTPFLTDPGTEVPAPPSLALFLLGGVGLMAARRRR